MIMGEAIKYGGFIGEFDVNCIDQLNRILAPGVIASAHDHVTQKLRCFYPKPIANRCRHRVGRVVEGQLKAGEAQHGAASSRICRPAPPPHEDSPTPFQRRARSPA